MPSCEIRESFCLHYLIISLLNWLVSIFFLRKKCKIFIVHFQKTPGTQVSNQGKSFQPFILFWYWFFCPLMLEVILSRKKVYKNNSRKERKWVLFFIAIWMYFKLLAWLWNQLHAILLWQQKLLEQLFYWRIWFSFSPFELSWIIYNRWI